jgi:predicted nucleic acid-binding protein
MKAVFDTNLLIDYLNGRKEAKYEFALYETKIISIITYIEVLVGASSPDEEDVIRELLSTFVVSDLSSSIAEKSITLRKTMGLKVPDAIIYATARHEGCLLVSRNTKDFKADWPDIRVPYK